MAALGRLRSSNAIGRGLVAFFDRPCTRYDALVVIDGRFGMRNAFLATVAGAVVLLGCTPVQNRITEGADASGEAVATLEREWVRAYQQKDVAWYERHLAQDFGTVLDDGRVLSRADVIEHLKSAPAPEEVTMETIQVRMYGDAAVATVTQRLVSAGGARGTLRMTDVWIRDSLEAWKVVQSHESEIRGDVR